MHGSDYQARDGKAIDDMWRSALPNVASSIVSIGNP